MKQQSEEAKVLDLMDTDYDLNMVSDFGKKKEKWREEKEGGGDEEDGIENEKNRGREE